MQADEDTADDSAGSDGKQELEVKSSDDESEIERLHKYLPCAECFQVLTGCRAQDGAILTLDSKADRKGRTSTRVSLRLLRKLFFFRISGCRLH